LITFYFFFVKKVVVGDSTGVVQLFTIKQRDPVTVFKTLPGKRVSRIELSGPGHVKDRIIVANASTISGYTKKGKQFYNFETNMTEPIKSVGICGDDLCISANYVYNQFNNDKEIAYYLSSDKINDLIILPTDKKLVPVLACHDRALRILDESLLVYEAEVAGPPTTLSLYNRYGGQTERELIYGTSDGKIGLIEIGLEEPLPKWELSNEKRLSGVSAIDSFDITHDGTYDLLVARDDGTIEVFVYDSMDNPVVKYTYNGNEGLTSIQGGCVGTAGFDEIVASTYNGWIFGLTTEVLTKDVTNNIPASINLDKEANQKMQKLKDDLDRLQSQVSKMRANYQSSSNNSKTLSQLKTFQINDKFELNRDEASYTLSIEAEVPIDNVLLACDVPIDLLDSEKNASVISFSDCDQSVRLN
jgi:Bardet-Biedl syndrome 7 protein